MFPLNTTRTSVSSRRTDPYKGVIFVLLIAAFTGMCLAVIGGIWLVSPVLFATAVTFGIATGILAGVAAAQNARLKPDRIDQANSEIAEADIEEVEIVAAENAEETKSDEAPKASASRKKPGKRAVVRLSDFEAIRTTRVATAGICIIAVLVLLAQSMTPYSLSLLVASISSAVCLVAVALAF